jgi:hypothetical protein
MIEPAAQSDKPPVVESATIAPRTRLIVVFALTVLPIASLGPIWPGAFAGTLVVAAVVFVVAALDAVLSRRSLSGLRLETPPVVRLHKGRDGSFEMVFHQARAGSRLLRVGCILPHTISTPEEFRLIELPVGANRATITWPCTPSTRGVVSARARRDRSCLASRPVGPSRAPHRSYGAKGVPRFARRAPSGRSTFPSPRNRGFPRATTGGTRPGV